MSADEFSLIDRYFTQLGADSDCTRLSIGDDAAVMEVPPGQQLVTSMDTLISGVHFPADTTAADIAYKALAVNLSDLAAMGATPAWFLLSLTIPRNDEDWLSAFASSLSHIAKHYQLELVGGDTCRGALSISIQINGLVPKGKYVTRGGAQPGDLILVSGTLGNAALGLAQIEDKVALPDSLREVCINALNRPTPRVALNSFLREYANAAIDLSDGLQGDLNHILRASKVGARLQKNQLPVNSWLRENNAYQFALAGGDDYEICCCIDARNRSAVDQWNSRNPDCRLTVIGEITDSGYQLIDDNQIVDLQNVQGYRHFD
ncbi:MAG: thiamine-monophosphate kinase [Gammaproteobacteria bacterium]|jgi:thiamine-monophosphate kinase